MRRMKLTRKESTIIWIRCVAIQGRTSNPDSPNAPQSGSITATITGNVFWLATSMSALAFSSREKVDFPPPEIIERLRTAMLLNTNKVR